MLYVLPTQNKFVLSCLVLSCLVELFDRAVASLSNLRREATRREAFEDVRV